MHRLQHWLDTLPLTDPIERQQGRVFQLVLIVWMILAALILPLSFRAALVPRPNMPIGSMLLIFRISLVLIVICSLLLLATPISALILIRRGRFKVSVSIAVLGLLLTLSIATYVLGITLAVVLIFFQIPVVLAGLLGSRRLLLMTAGLSILIVLAVTILESLVSPLAGFFIAGLNPTNGALVTISDWIDVVFFVGVTVLLTILLDRFGGALRAALTNTLAREEELHAIRASLETSVAERTAALQTALDDVQARADEQARLLSQIEEQRTMIRDLSVPVIPISDKTLVMPLVGALDSARLRQLQEQSLRALQRSSARTLLLDITGVPIVDTEVAQGLLMTVRAARLLGAQVQLVGIRPEVAQTIVGLGIDLKDVKTSSTLQAALASITA